MCQLLDDLSNSKKTVFSKWPMPNVVKSHMIKEPLTEQDRPMNFYITDYEKFVNIVSDSILQLIFKKLLPPVKFWCNNKNIHSYLKSLLGYFSFFLTYICVRPDFLLILQPKQPIPTGWMRKQIWESSRIILNQTLKRFSKCIIKKLFLLNFFVLKLCFFHEHIFIKGSLLFYINKYYLSVFLSNMANIDSDNQHIIAFREPQLLWSI